ncbi:MULTISPECIES: sulfurtransferase-like selenium metabolism protein YedF [Atopobiaceae]|uniref:Selenium metabolism protein YedF n=1 Tax=Parafannyhessea umbonata TaxID=604330 RepID=A0A1H9QR81_9ACTN|nr:MULTISPECIES: sulfurtransferase-like selenium metabolism protein YedF [Atopobiaceae]SEH44075.1 selenium metabolism protein YedF [Parafannyhessea umbonata]SER62954.1 selenium metabolism protein YedF [Parafannyhessea umbonata]SJZ59190.1 selenium metabolism protein YedF [Olsenella sp. KH1P3]
MEIDARNVTCPKPVVMTLEALAKLPAGESLKVTVNDSVALGNLTRLAQGKGIDLEVQKSGDESVLTFTPGENATASTASAEEEASAYCELPATTAAVIAVDSDAMGRGDAELGHILMKGLIYALAHQESVPKTMLFYNGGASLTCEGSESLEDIKELEARGTEILTCGTCLDFYGLREKLAVGGVTNLYAIAQILSSNPGVSVL